LTIFETKPGFSDRVYRRVAACDSGRKEELMQRYNTPSGRVAAICAAIGLGLIIGPAAPLAATGDGDGPAGTLPGDTAIPFWPHETGALVGTSETFVDVRADGSYFDPSVGRRIAGAADYAGTADTVPPNPFGWGEFALGAAFGSLLLLAGLVAAVLVGRRHRSTARRVTA
jgi:hypothetical protein